MGQVSSRFAISGRPGARPAPAPARRRGAGVGAQAGPPQPPPTSSPAGSGGVLAPGGVAGGYQSCCFAVKRGGAGWGGGAVAPQPVSPARCRQEEMPGVSLGGAGGPPSSGGRLFSFPSICSIARLRGWAPPGQLEAGDTHTHGCLGAAGPAAAAAGGEGGMGRAEGGGGWGGLPFGVGFHSVFGGKRKRRLPRRLSPTPAPPDSCPPARGAAGFSFLT